MSVTLKEAKKIVQHQNNFVLFFCNCMGPSTGAATAYFNFISLCLSSLSLSLAHSIPIVIYNVIYVRLILTTSVCICVAHGTYHHTTASHKIL